MNPLHTWPLSTHFFCNVYSMQVCDFMQYEHWLFSIYTCTVWPSWHTWHLGSWFSPDTGQLLEESAVLQVVLDDDIGHCVKDKLHVLGVGGACEVSVDLLGIFPLIQIFKLTLNVGSGLFICIWPCEMDRKYIQYEEVMSIVPVT